MSVSPENSSVTIPPLKLPVLDASNFDVDGKPKQLDTLVEFLTELQMYSFEGYFTRAAYDKALRKVGLSPVLKQTGIVPEMGVPPDISVSANLSEEELWQYYWDVQSDPSILNDPELERAVKEYADRYREYENICLYLCVGMALGRIFGQLPGRQQIYPTISFPTERTPEVLTEFLQIQYSTSSTELEEYFKQIGLVSSLEASGILPSEPEKRMKIVKYLHIGALLGRFVPELDL